MESKKTKRNQKRNTFGLNDFLLEDEYVFDIQLLKKEVQVKGYISIEMI